MTDIEKIASQAGALASANQAYSPTTAANIAASATDYLKQVADDLNQQIGGRYLYAGARYTTMPVADLTTLSGAPSATTTTNPALPSYDTNFNTATSFTVNSTPTGNFQVGNVIIPWSQLAAGNVTSVTVNGSPYTPSPPISGLSAGGTPSDLAANLATTLTQLAAQAPPGASAGFTSLTATSSGHTTTLNFNGAAPLAVTPDSGGALGEMTWVGGSTPDGTVAQTPNSLASAYTQDTALVDSNYSLTYGVSSDDPSFQKLINGLRFMTSAVTAGQGGDPATYKTDMQQATTLISAALSGIQTIHAGVANNQNVLTQQIATQNTDVTNLQNQITNIQQVDLTKVGTEINLLQTQLQASYSATSSLEHLSLVKYI
jgi:flagellin-like hook-associated protein FlgL